MLHHWLVVSLTLATAVSPALQRHLSAAQDQAAATCRFVVSTDGVPGAILSARSGEMVTLALPGKGEFGFRSTVRPDGEGAADIEILDTSVSPPKSLGTVVARVGDEAVKSDTTPVFAIRLGRILR